MKPKNTICLWFDKDAEAAARFYAAQGLQEVAGYLDESAKPAAAKVA